MRLLLLCDLSWSTGFFVTNDVTGSGNMMDKSGTHATDTFLAITALSLSAEVGIRAVLLGRCDAMPMWGERNVSEGSVSAGSDASALLQVVGDRSAVNLVG